MSDLVLMGVISAAVAVATSVFWIAYGTTRLNDLRLEHVERIQQINADTQMQRRVYGDIPIEKLIGREWEDTA